MLSILIVEDEPLFAQTLKHLVELNPLYSVTAVAEDSASALAAVEERLPDLALIDLQLANDTTGFSVAVKLHDLGVLCLFTTGMAPSFPMPDLALGCLVKPFSEDDLVRALKTAEDMLRGREGLRLRPGRPDNLQALCRGGARRPRRRSRACCRRPTAPRAAARPQGAGGPPLARRPAQRGLPQRSGPELAELRAPAPPRSRRRSGFRARRAAPSRCASTASWKRRTSKRAPSAVSARARNSRIFSRPIM